MRNDGERIEFGIFLPQIGFDYPDLLQRTRWVEELGFDAVWLYDHLFFPGLRLDVLEAWTTATALLCHTESIRIGHLVLCANFRHPVLLGKMTNSLQAIVPGRYLLGLGSGSLEAEHTATGLPWGRFGDRTERLAETLEIVTRMVRGRSTEFSGNVFEIGDIPNLPCPAPPPPIVIGGKGKKTLDLVARYADWWNCPTYAIGELRELTASLQDSCAAVGRDPSTIRITTQSVLVLVENESDVPAARALAERRFGGPEWGLREAGLIGTPDMVLPKLQASIDAGVRSFVFFLHDRGERATLELLAREVVDVLQPRVATSDHLG